MPKFKLKMNMKGLHKDQRGFSILELVIVILLTGIITTAITTTFFQVFNMNTRTANHMIAVSQVQQAGKIVSEDMLEAQPDKIDDNPATGEFLILGWTAQNSTEVHSVTYTLEYGELWREETIETIGDDPVTTSVRVAEYIDPDQTSCAWDSGVGVLTFTVTATVGKGTVHEESEQRVYRIKPRPESY
jgi:prepilin-type N-terminal cleavage/methylation domain-containing protein